MTNAEIGLRIAQRRRQLGLTMDAVAQKIGVAKSTVQRYEKGQITKIKLPVIESIASALSVNPNWIIGNTDDPAPDTHYRPRFAAENIIPMPETYKVPLVGTIACGTPILAVENTDGEVDVPDYIHADFALRCKGDSMINARIFDGDIVYIRQQDSVENGEIAAVLIDDEATLKRVRIFDDHISLEPENPQYKPIVLWDEEMNSVRILGKAVAFTSSIL